MKFTPQSLAKHFCQGNYIYLTDSALWQHTFAYLAKQPDDTIFDKTGIAALWAQHGGELRSRVKNDRLVLSVLRRALPGSDGNGLTLYRGESWFLFDQGDIGFCWTPAEETATRYAKGLNAVESGGVLLKCHAPAEAILAVVPGRPDPIYLCDPQKLLRMTTLALFPKC